ncbi:MAG TPA: hypothetical protein VJ890_22520 [Vineibacter sp.]|nr:hypothetical protein [Vineibacter sp.]
MPRYVVWEGGLYTRLSEIAEAKKDRALFAEAKRLVNTRTVLNGARETALQAIALAEVRAGLVADAAETVAAISDPGPVPAEIAVALATSGRIGDALALIGQTSSASARAWAWIRLARATRDPVWFDKASASIRDIADPDEHASQSRHLAVAQADLGRVEHALRTIGAIGDRAYQALALAEIARVTRNATHVDEAKRRVGGLNERLIDLEAWRAVVRTQIALGRLADAHLTLKRPGLEAQTGTLADDAGELAAAYWIKEGPRKAEAVLMDILRGFAERFWAPARYALAIGLADAGRIDSALLMAFLNDEANVDWALAHIAVVQARTGAIRDGLETADKVKDPGARSPALAKIAALLSN